MTIQEEIDHALTRQLLAAKHGKITAYFAVDQQTQEGTTEPLTTITVIPNSCPNKDLAEQFNFHLRGIADILRSVRQAEETAAPVKKEAAP